MQKIKLGISSCLMGEKVRYDGSHMRSRICMDELSQFCEWVPTCPEMAMGMPVPRPTIHQVISDEGIRLLQVNDHAIDYTEAMNEFNKKAMPTFISLSGYVVAKKSPSCGMERVKIWQDIEEGNQTKTIQYNKDGIGLFTAALMHTYPNLPIEEDGRLNDDSLRDNFITRIVIYHQWQQLLQQLPSYHALFQFHARVKYALMAADPNEYKQLGKTIANASEDKLPIDKVLDDYISRLMSALRKVVKRKHHHNVLLHIMGYFKKSINAIEKQNLREAIDDFYHGRVPLGVPVGLIGLYLKQYPNDYLQQQFYLFPYPKSMATRDFL